MLQSSGLLVSTCFDRSRKATACPCSRFSVPSKRRCCVNIASRAYSDSLCNSSCSSCCRIDSLAAPKKPRDRPSASPPLPICSLPSSLTVNSWSSFQSRSWRWTCSLPRSMTAACWRRVASHAMSSCSLSALRSTIRWIGFCGGGVEVTCSCAQVAASQVAASQAAVAQASLRQPLSQLLLAQSLLALFAIQLGIAASAFGARKHRLFCRTSRLEHYMKVAA